MYYLINEGEAERIAIDHCIKQNFSWKKRAQEFLNTLCYVNLSNISVKSSLDLIIDQYNHFSPKEYARVYSKIEKFLDEVVDSNKENLSDEDLLSNACLRNCIFDTTDYLPGVYPDIRFWIEGERSYVYL